MDFTGLPFLGFLTAVVALYHLCPSRYRCLFLLLSSYAFYLTWSSRFAVVLLVLTAVVFVAGRGIERETRSSLRRLYMLLPVATLVALLAFFKSVPLLQNAFRQGIAGHPFALAMPLGISYYSFKLIGYLIDIYWGATTAETRFIPFATYIVFFPQIVAGPIQKSESLLPQVHDSALPSANMSLTGVQRILLGFFKKSLVADNLGLLVDFVYSHLHSGNHVPVWAGFYGYPLQMYADFSGLTDISVGIALLLGIRAPENFNAPFSAVSPSDYWRRWHITLTLWLTAYVFTPLRMATRNLGEAGLVTSLVVNMVLIGLWHGFRWNFAIFGLVHAVFLAVDALTVKRRKAFYKVHPGWDRAMGRIGPVITFHLVAIGCVCFRAETPGDIVYVMSHLFDGLTQLSPEFLVFWANSQSAVVTGVAAYFIAEVLDYVRRRDQTGELVLTLPRWGRWSLYGSTAVLSIFMVLVRLAADAQKNPFIYAVF